MISSISTLDLLDQQLYHGIHGDFEKGKQIGLQLQKERPRCPRCKFNWGWYLLREGNLYEGSKNINFGREIGVFGSPKLKCPQKIYEGQKLNGEIVLLRLEGGFGDEIIGIRWAEEISKRGGRVIVSGHPGLAQLFSRIKNIGTIIVNENILPGVYFDYWIPAMSAEFYLNLQNFNEIPNEKYLTENKKLSEYYKTIIKSDKIKIGIRFKGNPEFEHEQHRTFPEELLFNAVNRTDVQLYSLQKDQKVKLPQEIFDLEPFLQTWEDTAAIISNLDLVITSCTSIAHLSAALGKPTWVVVPVLPYYIWSYQNDNFKNIFGDKSYYYESVTLFRQKEYGEWKEPFEKIKQSLDLFIKMWGENGR